MLYQECPPAKDLRPFIAAYLHLNETDECRQALSSRILPFFSKAILLGIYQEEKDFSRPTFTDQDQTLGYVLSQRSNNHQWSILADSKLFIIVFKPGKFRCFFPGYVMPGLNQRIDLCDFGPGGLIDLYERVKITKSVKERIRYTDKYLVSILNEKSAGGDLIDLAVQRMLSNSHQSLRVLCQNLPISERHFRRLFQGAIGISPKQFQKLIRFNQALQKIENRQYEKMSDIAYSCGYYDHSRFIEDFKTYLGMTPKQFTDQHFPVTSPM